MPSLESANPRLMRKRTPGIMNIKIALSGDDRARPSRFQRRSQIHRQPRCRHVLPTATPNFSPVVFAGLSGERKQFQAMFQHVGMLGGRVEASLERERTLRDCRRTSKQADAVIVVSHQAATPRHAKSRRELVSMSLAAIWWTSRTASSSSLPPRRIARQVDQFRPLLHVPVLIPNQHDN
jgi:hypothetical protein